MSKIKILLMSLLITGCSIEILPSHSDTDMSDKYGQMVGKFSEDSILIDKKATTPGVINLEEINYKQLLLINKRSKYTWVMLTAPWCAECSFELGNISNKMSSLKKDSIDLVLVYTNYDIKHIQKELFKIGYTNQAYILNAKEYSSNESEKINRFNNQVLESSKCKKTLSPGSVPQNFFFSSGKITTCRSGGKIDVDSVKYYLK